MTLVRRAAKRHIQAVFGIELVMTNLPALEDLLKYPAQEKQF
jgi:hypothetical protein